MKFGIFSLSLIFGTLESKMVNSTTGKYSTTADELLVTMVMS